jgi:hypothetical protein
VLILEGIVDGQRPPLRVMVDPNSDRCGLESESKCYLKAAAQRSRSQRRWITEKGCPRKKDDVRRYEGNEVKSTTKAF